MTEKEYLKWEKEAVERGYRKIDKRSLSLKEFIQKAKAKHGDKYDYSKVEYVNNYTKICIICPEHGEFWQKPNGHLTGNGCRRCYHKRRRSMVYGVGVYDYNGQISHKDNELVNICYSIWKTMLCRCYSPEFQRREPSYKGCSVCNEWKYFSNFKRWFDKHYIDGYQLDKDIFVKGNKVYSPITCCFVPHRINSLLTTNKKRRGKFVIGVSSKNGKFRAVLSCSHKNIELGLFDTEDDAFHAYKNAKETLIKQVSKEYYDKGVITHDVYEALNRYEVNECD